MEFQHQVGAPVIWAGALALLFLAGMLFNIVIDGLVFSIRVEGATLVVRLFRLIPIRNIYVRDIATARLGTVRDVFRLRWWREVYGFAPFSRLIITLRGKPRRLVLLRIGNAKRLLAQIQAFGP